MDFKPKKIKVLISIILVIAWYMLLYSILVYGVTCSPCEYNDVNDCPKVFSVNLIPEPCNCGCPSPTSFLELFFDLLLVLSPGILTYVIWSFSQKKMQ